MVINKKEKTKAEKGVGDEGWGSKQVTILHTVVREGLTTSEIIFEVIFEQSLEEREVI